MSVAIKFDNISKQYRLGNVGTGTLSHDLNRWWAMNIRGKEDPYLKIGSVNERSTKADSDYVWALRDINFEVQQGEVLGIIGKNGAGKSTLLKILSRVTSPTTGEINARGRIASLLEVGTGFHPEMTGRENIFMNGSIMGMTKAEIRRKMDEIVDFAGIERYIDTPVKRYSSGMTVRLGFAIAAHLEPEILVVDEVLAVGDAEFQKKAIGKIQDISKGEGRTVLFVSHNMNAINDLCYNAIVLSEGSIEMYDKTKIVIDKYLASVSDIKSESNWHTENAPGNDFIKLRKAYAVDSNYVPLKYAFINQKIGFCVEYDVLSHIPFFTHGINVYNVMGMHLFTSHDNHEFERKKEIKKGRYKTVVWIPENLLQNGEIEFSYACMRYNPFDVLFHEKSLIRINVIEIMETITRNDNYRADLPGLVRPFLCWDERLNF